MKEETEYDAEGVVGGTATEEELTTVFPSVLRIRIRIQFASWYRIRIQLHNADPDSDPVT
jgi:hypothetical protein